MARERILVVDDQLNIGEFVTRDLELKNVR
ncbi:MAG: hypothetical protein BMS9Abin28_1201 [Anaerolineae bacterium]|nr:MAG: hypothetical protein BMS9Abin28_1201 [Anaerolineae bacterium]